MNSEKQYRETERMNQSICKLINSHLWDDVSKAVFANRVMFDMTEDKLYLNEIVKTSRIFRVIKEWMINLKEKKVIYGMGDLAKSFISLYAPLVKFEYAVDSYTYGFVYQGIKVKSTAEFLRDYSNERIVICAWNSHIAIRDYLIKSGIPSDRIIDIASIIRKSWNEWQYFDLKELKISENEVFVDGGCYDAGNSIAFIKWCKQRYKKIYAYEPELNNYNLCKENLSHAAQGKFDIYKKGVWDENTKLHFVMGDDAGGRINESAEDFIETIKIDDSVEEKVTFIKLDVEGAEYQALKGAENQIKQNRPKLAVCVYHKPGDIIEIPRLILEMNPKYRLYLRHYSLNEWETVLYAIDD